jgi:hypothetical protein
VVRHERASIKADIWSYGILLWEIITGADIALYQPLAITRMAAAAAATSSSSSSSHGSHGGSSSSSSTLRVMALPDHCPLVVRMMFEACTQVRTQFTLDYHARPVEDVPKWHAAAT